MAQADYIVDNAPGVVVREDMNLMFNAIVTNNSGMAEPNTKYPGMWWLDLSVVSKPDGVWRYRSQANDRWLPLIPPPDGVLVPNLNADMLDGLHASSFAMKSDIGNLVGSMSQFPAVNAPANYLKVNGATISRTVYPELWAFAQASGLLAASQAQRDGNWCLWGPGDGVNSFQLPDMRGVFMRVADEGRGVDGGRAIGTGQGSDFASHNHDAWTGEAGWHGHSGNTAGAGGHQHGMPDGGWGQAGQDNGGGTLASGANQYGQRGAQATNWVGDHGHYFDTGGSGNHTHGVGIGSRGGAETRPINAAYPLFIRYR